MILSNLNMLLKATKDVQDSFFLESNDQQQHSQEFLIHRMQVIQFDEDQLDILVRILVQNERNGELVNSVYQVLSYLVEISKSSSLAKQNIGIIDMSKSLLQICIKHSSIYQCENAFHFLHSLVQNSERYLNKEDIIGKLELYFRPKEKSGN